MTKKYYSKNNNTSLLEDDDDEDIIENVIDWMQNNICNENFTKYFNCGCCDDCLCDDNIECLNCGCNCNGDEFDDDFDYIDEDEDENIKNFNINIIKKFENENTVRITFECNVILNYKKIESFNIEIDINNYTYLKIMNELNSL